jgi:hypothetical protein
VQANQGSKDRIVLSLKFQAVNRHMEHYENLISQVNTEVEKVLLLGDFEMPAVVGGFRDVLAEAWRAGPARSLINEDLKCVEQELGEAYVSERTSLMNNYQAALIKLQALRQNAGGEDEQIKEISVMMGTALDLWDMALVPARSLRQRLSAQLNQESVAALAEGNTAAEAVKAPEGLLSASPQEPRPRTDDERNEWIYQLACDLVMYKEIVTRLKEKTKETGWRTISSVQGIRDAATRYAERHGKPLPSPRQGK